MHPEILRELTAQRGRDMRARAHQARLARAARLASLVGRRGHSEPGPGPGAGGLVIPAIPDYVDGSFRAEPGLSEPAVGEAGQAPAAHRAA